MGKCDNLHQIAGNYKFGRKSTLQYYYVYNPSCFIAVGLVRVKVLLSVILPALAVTQSLLLHHPAKPGIAPEIWPVKAKLDNSSGTH